MGSSSGHVLYVLPHMGQCLSISRFFDRLIPMLVLPRRAGSRQLENEMFDVVIIDVSFAHLRLSFPGWIE